MPVDRFRSGALLCAQAFILLLGYAVARPSTESLFLEVHGADMLPWAWLGVALTSVPVVSIYNRGAARTSLGRVSQAAIAVSAASLAALLVMAQLRVPGSSLLLYIWKDVHIVVLLEGLWSFANLVFETGTAKWVYGLFCASGSAGGLCGNLLVGELAEMWGTRAAPWVLIPLFACQVVLITFVARAAGTPAPREKERIGLDDARDLLHAKRGAPRPPTRQAGEAGGRSAKRPLLHVGRRLSRFFASSSQLLRNSPYVGWLIALIAAVQIAVNLVDFVYNDAIAAAYPNTDERTAVIGQIYAAIDVAALSLQMLSGVVIRFAGVRLTLLAVPALLGAAVAAFVVAPRFVVMAVAKVASKAFDYSLFRAAKEILYIPLSYEDKTQGKALVDMLTYRVSKGVASLLILGLGALGAGFGVLLATLTAIGAWIAITVGTTRRYLAHADLRTGDAGER